MEEDYSHRGNWLRSIKEFNDDPDEYMYDAPFCFIKGLIESEREEFKKLLIEKCPSCPKVYQEPWNNGIRLLHGATVVDLVNDYIENNEYRFDEHIALRAREVESESRSKINNE